MFPEYHHGAAETTFVAAAILVKSFAIIDTTAGPRSYELKMDNQNGDVVHKPQDQSDCYPTITDVNEANGYLWLGSLIRPHAALSPAAEAT